MNSKRLKPRYGYFRSGEEFKGVRKLEREFFYEKRQPLRPWILDNRYNSNYSLILEASGVKQFLRLYFESLEFSRRFKQARGVEVTAIEEQ